MNTCVQMGTNKRTRGGTDAEKHDGTAAHRLWGGFGLRGLDVKMCHHSLQTLFIFCKLTKKKKNMN